MNIHMQKHPMTKEINIITKNRSISRTSEASSMEVAVTGMICEMKTKWAKPPTLLAAFERANLRALASRCCCVFFLAAMKLSYACSLNMCVRRRSVSNCLADGFVIPSANCASLETHRSKAWHLHLFFRNDHVNSGSFVARELGNFSTN